MCSRHNGTLSKPEHENHIEHKVMPQSLKGDDLGRYVEIARRRADEVRRRHGPAPTFAQAQGGHVSYVESPSCALEVADQ
jgi:hypothetical protein